MLQARIADRMTEQKPTIAISPMFYNVEVTGAARLYRAASVWTAGLELFHKDSH
jgi:hypothetical protein